MLFLKVCLSMISSLFIIVDIEFDNKSKRKLIAQLEDMRHTQKNWLSARKKTRQTTDIHTFPLIKLLSEAFFHESTVLGRRVLIRPDWPQVAVFCQKSYLLSNFLQIKQFTEVDLVLEKNYCVIYRQDHWIVQSTEEGHTRKLLWSRRSFIDTIHTAGIYHQAGLL